MQVMLVTSFGCVHHSNGPATVERTNQHKRMQQSSNDVLTLLQYHQYEYIHTPKYYKEIQESIAVYTYPQHQ